MNEFDPQQHETFISERFKAQALLIAKVAMFDELIDMHHDGLCSFDEAIAQYQHDLAELDTSVV